MADPRSTDTPTPQPDPALAWTHRVLLRVEVGSTAHGTGLAGQEDYDELGVMALPWRQSIGVPILSPRDETIVYRPGRREGERSQAGDYDLQVHSARKFASLACSGNPSILMVLFGPLRYSTPLGDTLRSELMIEAFWSQQARPRFLGYAKAQRERLLGIRGGKHTNRPELIDEHGFDTKYAMHMLRLGWQGIEYMRSGHITLPIPGAIGEMLRDVRLGKVPLDDVIRQADENERTLAKIASPAPVTPDYERICQWLGDVFDWEREGRR